MYVSKYIITNLFMPRAYCPQIAVNIFEHIILKFHRMNLKSTWLSTVILYINKDSLYKVIPKTDLGYGT